MSSRVSGITRGSASPARASPPSLEPGWRALHGRPIAGCRFGAVEDCAGVSDNGIVTRTLEAVYENGLLRPLEPLSLREHQRVVVTVSEVAVGPAEPQLDREYLDSLKKHGAGKGPKPSLQEVRRALAAIPGNLSDYIRAEREDR